MRLEREFVVLAIHGEGDRNTVNALQNHRNNVEVQRMAAHNMQIPEHMMMPADESPDVVIVLRDQHQQFRIEWPVETWEEVDRWKQLAGYDADKRHWKHGATVKVRIGD